MQGRTRERAQWKERKECDLIRRIDKTGMNRIIPLGYEGK